MEELIATVQKLPNNAPVAPAVARGLHHLDRFVVGVTLLWLLLHLPELIAIVVRVCSRAVAALLKETAKAGLPHRALELFDWLRGLPPSNDLSVLCDVFTYTTGMFKLCLGEKYVEPCN